MVVILYHMVTFIKLSVNILIGFSSIDMQSFGGTVHNPSCTSQLSQVVMDSV